jgi:mono/diheme cytochrome c family protein
MRSLFLLLLTVSTGVFAQNATQIDAARAQSNYMLNCQGCHLADGSGLPGSVPSMDDFVGSFLAVPGGREFLVQVPGSANAPLSDLELAELLNWILTTMSAKQLAADFQYYTEAEVRQLRTHTLIDVAAVRSGLVAKMH